VIFVDSNVPMYVIGAEHPLKRRAVETLESLILAEKRLVTSTEVFQEILHRYVAIGRRDAIEPAFVLLRNVIDDVFSIDLADVERARELVLARGELGARDALHVAVMARREVTSIFSFDRGFDGIEGLRRVT
jgi:hypothetical protein